MHARRRPASRLHGASVSCRHPDNVSILYRTRDRYRGPASGHRKQKKKGVFTPGKDKQMTDCMLIHTGNPEVDSAANKLGNVLVDLATSFDLRLKLADEKGKAESTAESRILILCSPDYRELAAMLPEGLMDILCEMAMSRTGLTHRECPNFIRMAVDSAYKAQLLDAIRKGNLRGMLP